ncbi:MAG: DNA-binding protein [Clostridia bacterium]|nr:DNA-binding protein [Clostridia bacterium]
MKINQVIRACGLLDFYGGLLTEKQLFIARSYLNYNASLSEIADESGTTRQAVSEILRRTLNKLEDMEKKLGLYAKYEKILENIPQKAKAITKDEALMGKITEEFTQLFKSLED